MDVKLQLCGGYVLAYDVATNRELFIMPTIGNFVRRIERYAAKRGWTLVNVRDGKVQL